jgi:hypothetical protein
MAALFDVLLASPPDHWYAPGGLGTGAAMHGRMSDSRQSPIPQDRVDANVKTGERAAIDKAEMDEHERYLKDQGVDERPGTNGQEQPGIPNEPTSPADGGD